MKVYVFSESRLLLHTVKVYVFGVFFFLYFCQYNATVVYIVAV